MKIQCRVGGVGGDEIASNELIAGCLHEAQTLLHSPNNDCARIKRQQRLVDPRHRLIRGSLQGDVMHLVSGTG
jgi:hypothetical protein